MHSFLMILDCPDGVGLLARITNFVASMGGSFTEVNQFTDKINDWFLARFAFEIERETTLEEIRNAFAPVARELNASWSFREATKPVKTILLVSKEDHCLADLLWRWRSGELNIEIPLVVSNHGDLKGVIDKEGIPFLHIPIPREEPAKELAFRRMSDAICEVSGELTVLCRYMQVLPDWYCLEHHNRIINIHNSLLPAFAGADPYKHAYDRGVKLIGATCHYATGELDAGPIIHQEVLDVEHFHTPVDLRRIGRDCERLALARGVRLHLEDRVVVHQSRAIVFGN